MSILNNDDSRHQNTQSLIYPKYITVIDSNIHHTRDQRQ